jgi:vitamin B12 transporter
VHVTERRTSASFVCGGFIAAIGFHAMATKGRILLIILALAATAPITVTASREPVPIALSGTAITVIDRDTIDALSLPLVKDYLTLSPSVSVSQSGPMGAQTQVRIRGAEANHTLTFVDGIDVTDPASSGEFRYETLLADGVERIEILRGPQSALWGSQAIGGVINILTRTDTGLYGEAEGGSLGTFHGGVGGGVALGTTTTLSGQASYLRSNGYDIANVGGDKDGYENFTTHAKLETKPTVNTTFSLVGRYVNSNSEFDGFDYTLGVPQDQPLSTRTRQLALRAQAGISLLDDRWTQQVSAALTDTANINRDGGAFQNQSDGGRYALRYQTSLTAETGVARHRITLALEHDRERFKSIDADPTALSNQSRSRLQTSLVGEYRLDVAEWLGGGIAVRHDWNNSFADTTTVRATGAITPGGGFGLHGSYGTGVSDPTFFDLYGYFPDYFVGNPALRPERSKGWDLGVGWKNDIYNIDINWYHATLEDEIVSTFDYNTFLSGVANATGRSRRQGLEISASARPLKGITLGATYAYLDATQQRVAAGLQVREVRRPRHSGSITASYAGDAFDLAASAAITGARDDTDFARFVQVRLAPYTLLTLSGAWHVTRHVDLTARIENALDSKYQDVFAYRTPGLTAHAGVRVRL